MRKNLTKRNKETTRRTEQRAHGEVGNRGGIVGEMESRRLVREVGSKRGPVGEVGSRGDGQVGWIGNEIMGHNCSARSVKTIMGSTHISSYVAVKSWVLLRVAIGSDQIGYRSVQYRLGQKIINSNPICLLNISKLKFRPKPYLLFK